MPPVKPSTANLDKGLVFVAGFAVKSARLSDGEKKELKALTTKGSKKGRLGFNASDRARCIWLIRKAGPETIPTGRVPGWLLRIFRFAKKSPDILPVRELAPTIDPLDRLEKLGRLRGAPLSDEQFATQVSRVLKNPGIATFGADLGTDALDRLSRVGELETSGVLTPEQAAELTQRILDAS